jgi:nuclear pore complex protein Nup133
MFAQEERYGHDIDKFFEEHPNRTISWIHDLGTRKYGPASQSLLAEAQNAPEVLSKELLLSIGKLSHLAQLHEADGSVDQAILDRTCLQLSDDQIPLIFQQSSTTNLTSLVCTRSCYAI